MSSAPRIERVSPRDGYDRWAATYDATPNPVVAMDERVTMARLRPRRGELVLDVGCGTGRHLARVSAAGARAFGVDFAPRMLARARRRCPEAELREHDLAEALPYPDGRFDAVLFALVAEHVSDIEAVMREIRRVLRPGGRVVMSVYHPEMAAAGAEANFREAGVEYRLGAYTHTTGHYLACFERAGLDASDAEEFVVDAALIEAEPVAARYLGRPVLLVITARRPEPGTETR